MAKITKNQAANLNRIWTERVACGLVHESREYHTAIDRPVSAQTGFAQMHRNASYNLVRKGLARVLVTKVKYTGAYGTFRVQVLVLTDAGRAAIGV